MTARPGAPGLPSRRLAKLRADPAGFFLQSRFPALRALGQWQARRLDRAICRAAEAAADRPVCVIVTVHNGARTIVAALDSLARQSHRALEVIVVDDAGTDGGAELVRAFCARDGRFRLLVNRENVGPYVSRNRALAQTPADFVTFQDADDLSHQDRIFRQLGYLLSRPSRLACLCSGIRVDEAGRTLTLDGRAERLEASTFFFRRAEAIESVGYFDSVRFAGDAEYAARLRAVHGTGCIGRLHEVLLTATFRDNSITRGGAGAHVWTQSAPGEWRRAEAHARIAYRAAYARWHATFRDGGAARIGFPQDRRPFEAPEGMAVQNRVERPSNDGGGS